MNNTEFLCEQLKIHTEKPFALSAHSTVGVGGNARLALFPKTIVETIALLNVLKEENIRYYVVGNMSNLLPCDEDTETVIVCMKKMTGLEIGANGAFAEAGVSSGMFLNACRKAEKSGGEFLTGIPCTIGGALYMNAGVSGRYIAEITDGVLVWLDGDVLQLPVSECGYAYKNSIFMQNGGVILGASFRLTERSEQEIEAEREKYMEKRKHLPKGKSMGCVFKNPDGQIAGELIEKSGLKGKRIGGAYISESHANFIINDNGATAADIRKLIALIKQTVFEKHNILLEEEIRYLT